MWSVSTLTPIRLALARLAVLALALSTAAAGLVLSASPAAAHAALESSSPADGSTVTAAPPEVALRFNEPVGTDFAEVTVTKGGTSATDGDPSVEGSTVTQPLAGDMEQGDWRVSYRVVSADGHPVSGTVDFTYAVGSAGGSTADESDASATTSTGSGEAESPTSGSTSGSPSSEATSTSSPDGSASPTSGDSSSGSSEADTTSTSPSESTTGSNTAPPTTDAANTADDDEGNDTSRFPLWGYIVVGILALGILGFGVRLMSRSTHDEKVALEKERGADGGPDEGRLGSTDDGQRDLRPGGPDETRDDLR